MVLNVENVLKLQADHETLLQLNGVEAFGALRVRAGEVGAGDLASPLREEVVTALHCGKHTGAKWHTTPTGTATPFLSATVQVSQWS